MLLLTQRERTNHYTTDAVWSNEKIIILICCQIQTCYAFRWHLRETETGEDTYLLHIRLRRIYLIAGPIRFLDYLKKLGSFILCVSDSGLQCNKHNSYWYGGKYQDRQTAKTVWGHLSWNWYFLRPRLGQYYFHWSIPRPMASLYILIFPSTCSISTTIL